MIADAGGPMVGPVDDLTARLRSAHRGVYRDSTALVVGRHLRELLPDERSRHLWRNIEPDDELVLESAELSELVPLDRNEWRITQHTCFFVPWQATVSGGRAWWKYGDDFVITPEGLAPDQALDVIRVSEPELFELVRLQQRLQWPVGGDYNMYCRELSLDGERYVALIDSRQEDATREIVSHWTRAEFDEMVQTALTQPVPLARKPLSPEIEAMIAQSEYSDRARPAFERDRKALFLFCGVIYDAPGDWHPPEVREWIEIRQAVLAQASDEAEGDLEPVATTVEESYALLEERAGVALKLGTFRRPAHSPAHQEARPARETIPREVRREVWRRDEGRCVDCGSQERLEYDHVIPLSRGGSNTARNLQLLCQDCNRNKGVTI